MGKMRKIRGRGGRGGRGGDESESRTDSLIQHVKLNEIKWNQIHVISSKLALKRRPLLLMKYFRYYWVPYTEVLKILLTGQADDEQRSPTRTERKHFCAFTLIKLALKLLVHGPLVHRVHIGSFHCCFTKVLHLNQLFHDSPIRRFVLFCFLLFFCFLSYLFEV